MLETNERATAQPLPQDIFQTYERDVVALSKATPPSASEILELLALRDRIAEVVEHDLPPIASLDALVRADRKLSDAAVWLASGQRRLLFDDWRKALGARAERWWWRLDEPDRGTEGLSPGAVALAGVMVAASLALMTDISLRLLSGGIDSVGLAGTIMQGFLALLAGGSLTAAGRQWLGRVLNRRRIPRGSHGAWIVGVSGLVLLLTIASWWSLRYVSKYYNNRGERLSAKGDIAGAMESYTRSLRAHPGNATVHYNLAAAKECFHDNSGAAEHYRAAIAYDNRMAAAYNNLARLTILEGRPAAAIELLQQGLERRNPATDDSYTFHKNLAWAYLESGLRVQARRELRIAAGVRDGAASHCLLARLMEEETPAEDASLEWHQCLSSADNESGAPEPAWLAVARERLLAGEKP